MVSPIILLPLYLYPAPLAWDPLYNALKAYPTAHIDVIINPSSGPQYYPPNYPDTNWLTALTTLSAFRQVRTLAYVPLGWGDRNMSDVETDISAYAYWTTWRNTSDPSGPTAQLDGVFLDETPTSTAAAGMAYVSSAAAYARSVLPASANKGTSSTTNTKTSQQSPPRVVLNPGRFVPSSIYDLADAVVALENTWADYELGAASDPFNGTVDVDDTVTRGKSVFIINEFDGDQDDLDGLVGDVVGSDIGGLYVESGTTYTQFGTQWSQLVQAVSRFS